MVWKRARYLRPYNNTSPEHFSAQTDKQRKNAQYTQALKVRKYLYWHEVLEYTPVVHMFRVKVTHEHVILSPSLHTAVFTPYNGILNGSLYVRLVEDNSLFHCPDD